MRIWGKFSFLFTMKRDNLLTTTLPEIFKSNMSEPCVWRNNHLRILFRVIHHKSFSYYLKNDLISNPQNSKLTMTILLSFTVLPSVGSHGITCTENSLKNVSLIPVINGLSEVSAIRQILISIYQPICISSTSRDLPTSQVAISYFWFSFYMPSHSMDNIMTHT